MANPAFMEIFNNSVVPRMVARMLKNEQTPEDVAYRRSGDAADRR